MHGGIARDAVGAYMRIDRVADREAGQAGQAAGVVCRGHAGECPDGERSSKEESRMKLTLEKAKAMMGQNNNGNLDLSGTKITALPDNLTVGGNLYLRGTRITALPDNLTVGGWLDLSNTKITALPDNLTVGGGLDLSGTGTVSYTHLYCCRFYNCHFNHNTVRIVVGIDTKIGTAISKI